MPGGRRGRSWRRGGVWALSAGVTLAIAATPAIAQQGDGSDQDAQRRALRDMTPEERQEFLMEQRRRNFAERVRRRLEAAGELNEAEIGAEVERRVEERFGVVDGQAGRDVPTRPEGEDEGGAERPGDGAGGGEDPGDAIAGMFEDAERIELAFGEPVSLARLVEIVGRALEINIFSDPGLENERIAVSAPVEVEKERLLSLLSTLLEDRGYVLTRVDEGFYRVSREPGVELGGDDLSTTRIIATRGLRPSGLVALLQSVFGPGSGARAAGGGSGAGPTITALDELGVLVVTGGSSALNRMEALIERLLDERERQGLHLLPVENVAAGFARDRMVALQSRLASEDAGGQRGPNRGQPQAGGAVSAGTLSSLDDRLFVHSGNTLLFRGTESELPEVQDLLRVVDKFSPLIARRYQSGGVTGEVVEAAAKLGLGSADTAELPGAGASVARQRQLPQQRNEDGAAFGDSRFLVDEENGSFVYFGTETQHEVVDDLVTRFREDMIDNGTQIRVYRLLYAQAAPIGGGGGGGGGGLGTLGGGGDGGGGGGVSAGAVESVAGDEGVAELLRQLIADPERRQEGRFLPGGQATAAAERGEQPVVRPEEALEGTIEEALGGTRLVATEENTVIVADPARNQVLIKAPALAHKQFERIIGELDKRQRQVRLDIKIVTLTTDDSFDWSTAVDLTFGDVNLSSLFGAGFVGDGDDITQPIAVNPISPGLTAGVIDNGEVPFAINTLATIGDTINVSNPTLFASDNQQATLSSEDEVPFAETTQNANTTTTGQGGTATAGTNVGVTPRISDAGEITLRLNVELSSFTGAATDGLQPPALRNRFETQITLPNNSTIIVGGFESEQESENESGIPLLKDIPILGNAFKSVSETKSRRAVFVFITPTILDDPNDLGLRLLTEGPLKEAGLDDGMPAYEPVVIPINEADASEPRRVFPSRDNWRGVGEGE